MTSLLAATFDMQTSNSTALYLPPGAAYANGLLPIAAARPPVGANRRAFVPSAHAKASRHSFLRRHSSPLR